MKIRIKRSVIVILLCISIVIRPGINIDGLKVKASPVVSDNYEDDGNVVNLFNSPSQTQSATSAAITFADYPITIDDSVFPDDNFRSYILTNIDLD